MNVFDDQLFLYYVDHNNYYLYAGADLVMISKEGTVNNVNV